MRFGLDRWNDFRCDNINEANVKAVADKMIALGLDKLGYQLVLCFCGL